MSEPGARHHENFAVRFERCWTIGNVQIGREIRTRTPGSTIRIIDCGVARLTVAACIRPGVEDRSIEPQDRRTNLLRGAPFHHTLAANPRVAPPCCLHCATCPIRDCRSLSLCQWVWTETRKHRL